MHAELLASAASASVESERSAREARNDVDGDSKPDSCDWLAARRDREDSALASGDRPGGPARSAAQDEDGVQARALPTVKP